MKLSWRHLLKKLHREFVKLIPPLLSRGNFPPTFGKRLASSTSKVSKGMLSGRMTYLRMVTVLTEETKNELLCSIQPYTSSIIFHTPSKLTPLCLYQHQRDNGVIPMAFHHVLFQVPPPDVIASDGEVIHGNGRLALHGELDVLHVHIHGHVHTSVGDDGDNNKQSQQARQAIEIVIRVSLLASHCHRLLWRPWLCSSKIIP